MLVVTRNSGTSLDINDVQLTLLRVTQGYVEVSLQKPASIHPSIVTLLHRQYTDICYGVRIVLLEATGARATLGFEYPDGVSISRTESCTGR
jgi:sRNA-binding carbon storage regulator CsrA